MLYTHIVWSTKDRMPFINPEVEPQLHAYLGEICKQLGCPPIQIGGGIDHVHVLCLMSHKISLMKLLEDLKSDSSKWIKDVHADCRHFYWQSGSGAFSVSPDEVQLVKAYIRNQQVHHQNLSFQDELRGLFRENGVDWDERYVWD